MYKVYVYSIHSLSLTESAAMLTMSWHTAVQFQFIYKEKLLIQRVLFKLDPLLYNVSSPESNLISHPHKATQSLLQCDIQWMGNSTLLDNRQALKK